MLGWRYIVPSFWIILKRVQDHSPSETSMDSNIGGFIDVFLFFWTFFWFYLSCLGCNISNLSVLNSRFTVFFKHSRGHPISLSYFCFGLVFVFLSVSFMVAKECGTWHWCGEDWTWRMYHQHFWWSWFSWDCQKIISEQAKEKNTCKTKILHVLVLSRDFGCLISVVSCYFHCCKTTESRDHVVYTLMICVFYLHQA